MKIERVSIEDNFFQDLGAHSLLMARFGAEIRKRLKISAVSMQDIYLNPTIEKLAKHIDALPVEVPEQDMGGPPRAVLRSVEFRLLRLRGATGPVVSRLERDRPLDSGHGAPLDLRGDAEHRCGLSAHSGLCSWSFRALQRDSRSPRNGW